MNFQFSPLSRDRFVPFFHLPEDALARHGAARVTANTKPGFPCRVSLEDAELGEDVLLVNFEHLDVNTPFRSRYAVYVRIAAKEARPAVNLVPENASGTHSFAPRVDPERDAGRSRSIGRIGCRANIDRSVFHSRHRVHPCTLREARLLCGTCRSSLSIVRVSRWWVARHQSPRPAPGSTPMLLCRAHPFTC
jgi:hypothetical protein